VLVGDALLQINGQLIKADGVPWPATPPKFRFQVFDPSNALPLSQTAGPVLGVDPQIYFQIYALRTGNRVLLRASPEPTAGEPVPAKDFLSNDEGRFDATFVLGDYGDAFDVTGRVTDAQGTPIANAQVLIEGVALGGGTLSVRSVTDASGNYTARLLGSQPPQGLYPASQYQFVALPPSDSGAAPGKLQRTIDGPEAVPTIVCGPKLALEGRVVDSAGTPLADAIVHYEGDPNAASPGRSSGDVKTDGAGTFSVLVDPGGYRVTAKPGARLPWATRRVEAGASEVLIAVSATRTVYGSVTSRTSTGDVVAIPNAVVRVYRVPPSDSGFTAPTLVYEELTDDLGNFKVFVPRSN
jgi:hypothetical protein